MMEKLMEFCKSYDVEFSMHWVNNYEGFVLKMTRIEDGVPHFFSIAATDDDFDSFSEIDMIFNSFVDRAVEEFNIDTNIESILTRADVKIEDIYSLMNFNPFPTKVFTSKNTKAPLTEFEQSMIRRMFENQAFLGRLLFVVAEV